MLPNGCNNTLRQFADFGSNSPTFFSLVRQFFFFSQRHFNFHSYEISVNLKEKSNGALVFHRAPAWPMQMKLLPLRCTERDTKKGAAELRSPGRTDHLTRSTDRDGGPGDRWAGPNGGRSLGGVWAGLQ